MQTDFTQLAWLIPLFPLVAFILITAMGKSQKAIGTGASVLLTASSFVLAVLVFFERLGGDVSTYSWNNFEWLSLGKYHLNFGFEITNLNAMMLVIVTLVALLVNLYSLGYMKDDERIATFFGYVSLFTFSMLGLVISINLLELYVFWELVGVCSFLLVGFWYHKPEARAAAKKAFIVTRIGDVGLFIGMALLFWHVPNHDLTFTAISHAVHNHDLTGGLLTAIAILIFVGAVGKSGQFPLHTWLPDAMEGPTPISALIHAATMVAAGVYLVARTYDLFLASHVALLTVAIIGGFTAIFAATIAVAQSDIKRILAYSTVSQLGYMMFAMGIGTTAAYTAGLFHLLTHAFFKALLFLAAGSVIHAVHEQDIFKMGGLGKHMKITTITFAIGTLALAGVAPLSGFWSKDAILAQAYEHQPFLFVIGLIAAFFTAFYMSRLFFVVFTGKSQSHHTPHESPAVMTVPLLILAVLAVIAGFVYFPGNEFLGHWLTGVTLEEDVNWVVILASNAVALGGIFLGYRLYGRRTGTAERLAEKYAGLHRLLRNKYYVDEAYEAGAIRPLGNFGGALQLFDAIVVEGAVKLVAGIMTGLNKLGVRLQNGQTQTYGVVSLIGILLILAWFVRRRF
jgi:NADH-quinone oxidoreductase subunit L